MQINEIVEKLLKAKKEYYTSGNSFMSDSEFDSLEDKLKKLDPNNKYFSIVGTNIKGSNNIKHNHPLLSCAKGKQPDDAIKWLERINYNGSLVGMAKLDGLTGCVTYVNGKFSHMVTRGDGVVGQDISHLANYINIPKEIPCGGSKDVVGEIILPKNTKLETNGKPLRNIASGLVNRKEVSDDLKHLHFVTYNLIGLEEDEWFSDRLKVLEFFGFEIVEKRYLENSSIIKLFYKEYETELREKWIYETDGIILQVDDISRFEKINSLYEVNHHFHHNFALKPKSESAITLLTGITWDVSKYGYVIPVANFEPIELGNKTITSATLNNYENVENLDLHIGDTIEIENANEVIPFFKNKISDGKGESLLTHNCPCCGSLLKREGVHIKCFNKDCPDKVVKTITSYCTKCEMDGVSESTIRTLYEHTFIKSIKSLYRLHEHYNMLVHVPGFGVKKIDNLLKQIEKSKKQTVVQFISRLGIENVGERAVKNLGIDSMEKFWKFNDTQYINGQSLITFRRENEDLIKELLSYIEIQEEKKTTGNKLVCMTGKGHKGRKELIQDIESKGYSFSETINKDLEYLICEDVSGSSSKLVKARKLGVKLISYKEFFNED